MWEWRTIARSPALSSGGMTDGEEVQGAVEVALLKLEIRGGDCGREAIVERLGQVQRLMDTIPAELDRELVDAQLASVKEAEHLDPGEVGRAEIAELGGAVLAHVPGVVGLLGSRRRQRQQVGRGDVGDAARRQHRLEVLEDRPGVL